MKNNDISKLERDIKYYEMAISSNPNNDNAYNLQGQTYAKLAESTNNQQFYYEAIKYYDQAIAINPNKSTYLCDRSKLYALIGEPEKAVLDFRKVNELVSSQESQGAINDHYVQHTLKKVAKLDNIQDTIKKLESEGKLDTVFFKAFSSLAEVTTGLVVQVSAHDTRLSEHDQRFVELEKSLEKALAFIEELQEQMHTTPSQESQIILTEKVKQQEIKILDLQEKVKQTTNQLQIVESVIDDSKIKELAEIKKGFEELEASSPILYNYCKTFYWTLSNYFEAYRVLDSEVIEGSSGGSAGSVEEIAMSGVKFGLKKGMEYTAKLAQGIPIIGGVVGVLDKIIDEGWNEIEIRELRSKTNIINKIIQNCDIKTSDDIDITIGRVALEITNDKFKQQDILLFEQSKGKKAWNWLNEKIKSSVPLREYSDPVSQLALQDVSLLLYSLYKNHASIINKKVALHQQLAEIVVQKDQEQFILKALEALPNNEPQLDVQPVLKKSSCIILTINEIKYDNPILNYPEMLKTLTDNLASSLSFWKVVDRVNSFDREFVEEVCLSGNVKLLQECLELG